MILSRLVRQHHLHPSRTISLMAEAPKTVVKAPMRPRSPSAAAVGEELAEPVCKRRRISTVAAAAPTGRSGGAPPVKQVRKTPTANKDKAVGDVDPNTPWLIVGLGNPGANYEKTRHNVGFMLVDELARLEGIDCRKLEKSAAVGRGEICGKKVILAKPMTFMNNSGESVQALAHFYKVPLSHILVISDDLDIPNAAIRLRAKGGHGGHNGLRSIMAKMGNTQDFPRIKIGIGRPSGPIPIATYVLQEFNKKEAEDIGVAVSECVDIVKSILSVGIEKALSGVRA